MTELAALLENIRRNPDDDTPRPVAADLLEESGNVEWAKLIRAQIRLEQLLTLDTERSKEEDSDLEKHADLQRQLLMGPISTSNEKLPESLPFDRLLRLVMALNVDANLYGIVTRGFVDEIDCMMPQWILHGDELLAWLPLQTVRLWTSPTWVENENGLVIIGDPHGIPIPMHDVREAKRNGEGIETTLCRLRWRGVHFEILSRVEGRVGVAFATTVATVVGWTIAGLPTIRTLRLPV